MAYATVAQSTPRIISPPSPRKLKYVSVFRINGQPILPPMMTISKRNQMHNYKEKAIKLEKKMLKAKQRRNINASGDVEDVDCVSGSCSTEDLDEETPRSNGTAIEMQHRLQQDEDMAKTYTLLKNLTQKSMPTETNKVKQFCNASTSTESTSVFARRKLLQKSETLVYDNCSNAIIMQMTNDNMKLLQRHKQQPKGQHDQQLNPIEYQKQLLHEERIPGELQVMKNLKQTDCAHHQKNVELIRPPPSQQRPHSLELQKNTGITAQIPAICVNPPTPNEIKPRNAVPVEANLSTKTSNFDDGAKNRNAKVNSSGKSTEKLQRSATSPSLNVQESQIDANKFQLSPKNSPETLTNSITRSNSFTLECPSKALIQHMEKQRLQQLQASQQILRPTAPRSQNQRSQNTLLQSSNTQATSTLTPIKSSNPTTSSTYKNDARSSIRRETVESKAKRVNKTQFKERIGATTSISKAKHNECCRPKSQNTTPTSSATKKKRSPYDLRMSGGAVMAKRVLRKTSNINRFANVNSDAADSRNKQLKSEEPLTSVGNNALIQIESTHRQKFLQLIAQQQEEQKRLQATFDAQQKKLLEQICSEMNNANLSTTTDDGRTTASEYTTDCEMHNVQMNTKEQATVETASSSTVSSGISLRELRQLNPCKKSPTLQTTFVSDEFTQKCNTSLSHKSSCISLRELRQLNTCKSSANNNQVSLKSNELPKTLHSPKHLNSARSVNTTRTTSPNTTPTLTSTPTPRSITDQLSTDSIIYSIKSRKRLFPRDQPVNSLPADFVLIGENCDYDNDFEASLTRRTTTRTEHNTSSNNRRKQQQHQQLTLNERRIAAATRINACVRGFLVRRLFRTEQIQRIVQTIRDTLVFVLNLHLETSGGGGGNPVEDDTPANIRLKARLLQQLCSASRTLHLVLFQTTMKERMEIIARDRKRIKTKLLTMSMKRNSAATRIIK